MNLLTKNTNRVTQPKQCCVLCGKGYKTRTNLEKHILLCELVHRSKSSRLIIEEEEAIPSQRVMYQMLIELGQKYTRLEEKMDEINKWVIKKKKKINILEWLNSNITPNTTFENLTETIIITDEHVEILLNNSFYDTLNEIFASHFYYINEQDRTFIAFSQNNNMFYIYDKVEEQNIWAELTREKLIKFLNKIQMKISKKFYEWKKSHKKEINEDEKFSEKCDKTTIKIMSVEFKQDATLGKIKTMMYTKMKTDMKALVEYEFEF